MMTKYETCWGDAQRRREPRIRPSSPLDVEILGPDRAKVPGRILDISSNGLSAYVSIAVTPGTAIKIDTEEELMLAEVCYCRPLDAGFRIGLIVKHRLGAALATGGDHRARQTR